MYSVRKVKTFEGMEGQGFNAELMRDGRPVAFVIDEASGGEYHFDWYDQSHGESAEEKLLTDFCAQLPKEKLGPEFCSAAGDEIAVDPDMYVGRLVDEYEDAKRLVRLCRTRLLFRVKGDTPGEYRTVSLARVTLEQARAAMAKKYGDTLEEVLNDRFNPEG